jgi:hypothetical protein
MNTSYHHPIALKVSLQIESAKNHKPTKPQPKPNRVYNLGRIDAVAFQSTLDEELGEIQPGDLDADAAIHILQCAINTATHAAAPGRVTRKRPPAKNSTIWSPELAEAVQLSKQAHYEWKTANRPREADPLWQKKKEAKKKVRRVQRRQAAQERSDRIKEIDSAAEKDHKLFHKLVKRQRQRINPQYSLLVNGTLVDDPDEQRDIAARYFSELASPQESSTDDNTHYLRTLYQLYPDNLLITKEALDAGIRELAKGKAKDIHNHAAEQIQLLTSKARELLLHALQQMANSKTIPHRMKLSYKIALPKSGKDNRLLDNHRGITIESIFMKTLEIMVANLELRHKIDYLTNNLQVGFTRDRSPSMASLLITEALAETNTQRKPLFIATLDARKAFDVCRHDILRMKLHQINVSGGVWGLVDGMYTNAMECVRWMGQDSDIFSTQQGVKQGSIISPMLYKLYINNLLDTLQRNQLGTLIGNNFIGTPTCADDILLISSCPHELQAMLDVCSEYSVNHSYQIHPGKSIVCTLHQPRNSPLSETQWYLGSSPVTQNDSFTHLGIEWKKGSRHPSIDTNISKARRAAYSLMSTGLHGHDGLGPATSVKLIQLYVTPCLLHGLDSAVLDKKSLSQLETFYRKLLRQVQSLPDNTAIEAVHWLSGTLPVTAQYHIRSLTLFGAICRLPNGHTLRQLANRQIAMGNRHSWFSYILELSMEYGLNVTEELVFPSSKPAWKKMIKKSVSSLWHLRMLSHSFQKPSLQWMLLENNPSVSPHHIWKYSLTTLQEAAATRAKLLTGSFQTGVRRAKFYPQQISSTCQRCNLEVEDTLHMLVECPDIKQKTRDILQLYITENKRAPRTSREICSAILK